MAQGVLEFKWTTWAQRYVMAEMIIYVIWLLVRERLST